MSGDGKSWMHAYLDAGGEDLPGPSGGARRRRTCIAAPSGAREHHVEPDGRTACAGARPPRARFVRATRCPHMREGAGCGMALSVTLLTEDSDAGRAARARTEGAARVYGLAPDGSTSFVAIRSTEDLRDDDDDTDHKDEHEHDDASDALE